MLTKDEIYKIAELSKINIDEDEMDLYEKDMNSLVSFADRLCTNYPEELIFTAERTNDYREDIIVPSYDNKDILSNSCSTKNGFFKISGGKSK